MEERTPRCFPSFTTSALIRLLNNAYSVLFPEVFTAVLVVCQTGDANQVTRFLKRLFTLYEVGVVSFLVHPAIGPCLYYPESLDLTRNPNLRFMSGMLHDFRSAASADGGALRGYGYFMAVPSLHVLICTFLQATLAIRPVLFRVFLPVNTLLIASTSCSVTTTFLT
jgi:hypothetical protein